MFSTLVIRANEVDDAPSAALSDDTLLALSTQPLDAQQQSIESSVNTKWNRATHLKAATSDSANSQGSTSSLISQGLKSKPNRSSRSNIMAAALGISKASRSSHDTGDTLNNESFEKVLNGRWERALDIAAQHRSSTDLYTGGKNGTNNVPGMNTEISRSSSSAPLRRDSSRRVASVVLSGVSSSAASKQSEDKVSKKANDRWERASHLMHSQSYGGAFDPPPPGSSVATGKTDGHYLRAQVLDMALGIDGGSSSSSRLSVGSIRHVEKTAEDKWRRAVHSEQGIRHDPQSSKGSISSLSQSVVDPQLE